ncbi:MULTISPECIES: hypothetical protein [unclassified Streptomyces]|uniref:hypothetical protein n=1 Tax=unclassified Streptomyces TaxID=2593676 RepID=UPI001F4F6C43|nr:MULTISPECIES: hypothetical protein [unclassified Streptomyces]
MLPHRTNPPTRSTRIPRIEPRRHVVAQLVGAYFQYHFGTTAWHHHDGGPYTEKEQAAALAPTTAEVEEAQEQIDRYHAYLQTWLEAPEALDRFLAPFMEQLDEKSLGNAIDIMNMDEQVELQRLINAAAEPVRPFTPYAF